MASVSKLALTFVDTDNEKMTINYNHCDPDVNDAKVKALMQGIVANSEIFSPTPSTIHAAKIVTTETTTIDLN